MSQTDLGLGNEDMIVLTIPSLYITGTSGDAQTKQYIAAVSYDFSGLSSSYYADTNNTLTFYNYDGEDGSTAGTALFLDESGQALTAYKINSSKSTMNGYIVMTLTSGDTYYPFVAAKVTSLDFAITHESVDIVQLSPASSDTVAFTALNPTGNIKWTVETSYSESYSYPVTASIVSSDEDGHTATLTLSARRSADIGQEGWAIVTATDMTTGASATTSIQYDVYRQLTISPASATVSVDINASVNVTLQYNNASGDVEWSTSEGLWTSFENADAARSRSLVITPYDSFLEGSTWPVNVTVKDSRNISCDVGSEDKRGIATATINVYVYSPLSVDVSSTEFTVSSADQPDVTFTASNASGDVSFDVSVDWASVQGSKFVVSSLDPSLAGTTQTVTVTARDDRGRAGNSRGEASLTLSVTISNDVAPAFSVAVSPESITVNQGGSASATLTPTNAIGEVTYTSSASWASPNGNTITVNYDSAYANTTQPVTITATDAGRESNNTAEATLSVTFGAYNPGGGDTPGGSTTTYSLSLTPESSTFSVPAGALQTVNLSLSGANGTGVTWSYGYDSVPAGADSSSNPLGLSFMQEGSSSAVLVLNTESDTPIGTYTVHIYTNTTTGTSFGGDNTITITIAPAVLTIDPDSVSQSLSTGEDFSLEFTALNAQGALSWSISNASWTNGTNPLRLSPLSLEGLTSETITITVRPVLPGSYSFTVNVADEDGEEASSSVALSVTGEAIILSDDARRAGKAPSITITPVALTPAMKANLRETLGLAASVDIYELTADNLLSPVSPDAETEYSMKQRGYQLAANLSRISVARGGLYAFQFSIPSSYLSLRLNDLTVFSQLLGSAGVSTSSVNDAAYDEDGLYQGSLAATDGTELNAPAREMLAVVELEPNTTSGTYFGSKVIPAEGLNELAITTVEITDTIRTNLRRSLSDDVADRVRSITEDNIRAPIEPTQRTIDEIKAEDNFELAYKLNSIVVDETNYYAFNINIPSELLNANASDVRVYVIDQNAAAASSFRSSIITGVLNVIELDAFGLELDSLGEQILAIGLLNAGTPFSVYLGKLILMLLMGGCQVSFSGMGMIALTGAVLILGGARLLKRR